MLIVESSASGTSVPSSSSNDTAPDTYVAGPKSIVAGVVVGLDATDVDGAVGEVEVTNAGGAVVELDAGGAVGLCVASSPEHAANRSADTSRSRGRERARATCPRPT
jgi:hypothetical protein